MKRYHVHYVTNCSPKVKSFKTKKALDRFIKKFDVNNNEGKWINFSFKGKFLWVDEYFEKD